MSSMHVMCLAHLMFFYLIFKIVRIFGDKHGIRSSIFTCYLSNKYVFYHWHNFSILGSLNDALDGS